MMSSTPIIIALTGLAGAGKDTVADTLVTHAGFRKLAFADALRLEVAGAFRMGGHEHILSDRLNKERPQALLALCQCHAPDFVALVSQIEDTPSHYEFMRRFRSPRQIMQWWGTEYRRAQQPNYWSTKVAMQIAAGVAQGETRWVIPDCRFDNEAQAIRSLGGEIWQVVRPGLVSVEGGHASQTTGDDFAPEAVLLNGSNVVGLMHTTLRALQRLQRLHGGLILPDDLETAA